MLVVGRSLLILKRKLTRKGKTLMSVFGVISTIDVVLVGQNARLLVISTPLNVFHP